jgi:hypothetical protein
MPEVFVGNMANVRHQWLGLTAAILGSRSLEACHRPETETGVLGVRRHRLTTPHPEVLPNAPAAFQCGAPVLELPGEPSALEVPDQSSRRCLQPVPRVTELEQQPASSRLAAAGVRRLGWAWPRE